MEKDVKLRPTAEEALRHDLFSDSREVRLLDESQGRIALESLVKFQDMAKLKQAVLTFISSNLTTKEEVAEIMKLFKEFDQNRDGSISKEEFVDAYKQI